MLRFARPASAPPSGLCSMFYVRVYVLVSRLVLHVEWPGATVTAVCAANWHTCMRTREPVTSAYQYLLQVPAYN
jgi:hypothetical protein